MAHSCCGFSASLLLCAVAALSGCSSKSTPPTPAAPAPVSENRSADGTYRGSSTRYQAERRSCPSPGLVTLRVLGGVFSYRWNRDLSVLATIQADGRASGEAGDITLTARADGEHIEGDVSNAACAYHFKVTQRP